MANLKSSKKRILTGIRKRDENIPVRSKARTAIKKVEKEVQAGNKELAETNLKEAFHAIDKAQDLRILHKNKVARLKSRLTKLVNNME